MPGKRVGRQAKITSVGEVDFFTQGFSGLNAAVRGLPLKILMVVDEKPDWDFIAQPQIKSFAQLKGAAVGILSIGGTVAVVTREMLRRNNLDPAKDVNLMVMGGNDMRFISLKGKVIQATLLMPPIVTARRKRASTSWPPREITSANT